MTPSPPPSPDGRGLDALVASAYTHLKRLAASHLRRDRQRHVIEPAELVHECYLRLADGTGAPPPVERTAFLALAASVIRRALVDRAREQHAQKRGGDWERIELRDVPGLAGAPQIDLLDLDGALQRLGELDERQARVVEMRFFGGLTLAEIAGVLELSTRTVDSEWRMARAWLKRELTKGAKD